MKAGGAATGGGMNFQTAVTTLIAIHIATGRQISWVDSVLPESPISLSTETSGGGDDIRVDFESGCHAEMQVKKGLRRGPKLWSALESLAQGIARDSNEVGVLVVCGSASTSIKNELRKDIERIGDGRRDALKEISAEFVTRLESLGFSPEGICTRLRIYVVDAIEQSSERVQIALRDLETICLNGSNTTKAWDSLYRDSARLIEIRGRRDIVSIGRTLRSADVRLKHDVSEPASVLSAICQFNIQTNAELTIPGYNKALPIEDVWISTKVKEWQVASEAVVTDFTDALVQYQKSIEAKHSESTFDIEWLGRFVKHVIVVGGPGAGKTTAAKMLSRRYSLDGLPVLRVRLPQIVKRLANGEGLWDALVSLGLDGSGLNPNKMGIQFPWVVVADGLDECGSQKSDLSERLANLAKTHPHLRIIITTRPIGYDAAALAAWRHYRMLAQDDTSAVKALTELVEYLSNGKVKLEDRLGRLENVDSDLSEAIRRTPLVLALSAVLLAEGQPLARTKAGQYSAILRRIEANKKTRANDGGLSDPLLRHVLNAIGDHIIASPLSTTAQTTAFAVGSLSSSLGLSLLQSEDQVDRAISYWKEIGILENVAFNDDSYLTFIHRSFAEFASARYMIDIATSSDAIDEVILERISDDKWTEVIDFAGYLEWNHAIIAHLISGFSPTSICAVSVAKALKVAAYSTTEIDKVLATQLFNCVLQLGQTGRRDIISILAKHSLNARDRFPDIAFDVGNRLSKSEKPWSRLLGWTLLLGGQSSASMVHEIRSDVPSLVETILNDRDRDTTGVINLDRSPNRLIEQFAIRLIDAFVEAIPNEQAVEALSPIISLRDQLHMGFYQAVQERLIRYGLGESFQKSSFERGLERTWDAEAWANAFRESLQDMFMPFLELLTPEELLKTNPSDEEKHLQMSAILHITNFWHMGLDDISGAESDDLKRAEQEVMRGLINAAQIDLDQLVSEVIVFNEAIKHRPDADFRLFDRTVQVDCDLPTWLVNLSPALDFEQLSKSICESNPWMAQLATALVYANADNQRLEQIVNQALEHKSHSSLLLAAHLAEKLPTEKAISMLVETAADYDVDVSPVLNWLGTKATWSPQISEIVEGHLLRSNVDNAIAATGLLSSLGPESSGETTSLARQAYEYWRENEQPYPVRGGTVPRTPRDTLVELVELDQWSDEKLFEAASDLRPDVRKCAIGVLSASFDERVNLQTEFVERCINEQVSLDTIRETLRKAPNLNQHTAIQLAKYLLNHSDKKWRYVGLGVFELKSLTDHQKEELLSEVGNEQPVEIISRIEGIRAGITLTDA